METIHENIFECELTAKNSSAPNITKINAFTISIIVFFPVGSDSRGVGVEQWAESSELIDYFWDILWARKKGDLDPLLVFVFEFDPLNTVSFPLPIKSLVFEFRGYWV